MAHGQDAPRRSREEDQGTPLRRFFKRKATTTPNSVGRILAAARLLVPSVLDTEAPAVALDPVKTKVKPWAIGQSAEEDRYRPIDPKAFASYVLGWSDPSHDVMDIL